jgi:hypothetical protein
MGMVQIGFDVPAACRLGIIGVMELTKGGASAIIFDAGVSNVLSSSC